MRISKTKAAILVESNAPLVVADIELPERLECGQVLVEVLYSGICGAQLNEIAAAKGPDKWLPHLLGHEGCAKVLEVGPAVTTVKPGDTVVMHWRPSAGIQSPTPAYNWQGRKVNAGWVTTFNQHAVVSENRLTTIPDSFDPKLAPLFGCAVTTAVGVINNDAKVSIGQSVVIFGTGGVGLNLGQAATMVSAYPVVGIDIVDSKLAMAEKFGCTHTFNSAGMDPLELATRIRRLVGEKGADVVIDCTGNPRVIELAYDLTNPDGSTILVGVPKKGDHINIYSLPLHFKKTLTGSEGGSCVPDVEIPRLLRLIDAGRLSLEGLITHEFKLDDINQALDLVRSGEAGRVLVSLQDGQVA